MAEIAERREVRVTEGDSTFVFVADPDAGRLAIREEDATAKTPRCAASPSPTARS